MANAFPRWTNSIVPKLVVALVFIGGGITLAVNYYATPKATRVGYMPDQPIPFDHSLHAGQLGMDCRHCHNFVEKSHHSNVPNSQTCWNCHQHIKRNSPKLAALRVAMDEGDPNYTGKPVPWVQVHKTPDYAYFNHSAHLNRGISCVSCHGKVNEMKVVWHAEPHSMGWCLDCHRAPENHLRPLDKVTDLDWVAPPIMSEDGKMLEGHDAQVHQGLLLAKNWKINPPTSCAACHR